MKILWFTNTPCLAASYLGLNAQSGSWLSALEREISLRADVDLHIAFYHTAQLAPFRKGQTTYHPISRNRKMYSRVRKCINKWNCFSDNKEIEKLQRVIKDVSPDVIHIHGAEENYGLVLENTDIPGVISIQGISGPIRERLFAGIPEAFVRSNLGFLSRFCDGSGAISMDVQAKREEKILAMAPWIMGRTDWDRRVTRLLAPNSRYIHGDELLRPEFGLKCWDSHINSHGLIRITTIMSGGLYKGMEVLLRTAYQLKIWHRDLRFEWVVIGQSLDSPMSRLAVAYTGIKPESVGVVLIGTKSACEIVDIMVKSTFYCQVSHIENSPNSLCEAMMLGMPCIATFAGGTSSLLSNGEEGILVQDGDSYALAGAIIELLMHPEDARHFGISAREKAKFRHAPDRVMKQLMTAYGAMMGA